MPIEFRGTLYILIWLIITDIAQEQVHGRDRYGGIHEASMPPTDSPPSQHLDGFPKQKLFEAHHLGMIN